MLTCLLVCRKQRHESLLQLCISSLSACQKVLVQFRLILKIPLLNTLFVGDFHSDFSFYPPPAPRPVSPSTPKAGWGSSPVYLYFLSPPIPPPLPDHLGWLRHEQFFLAHARSSAPHGGGVWSWKIFLKVREWDKNFFCPKVGRPVGQPLTKALRPGQSPVLWVIYLSLFSTSLHWRV